MAESSNPTITEAKVRQMNARTTTSISINNNVFAESRFWQRFPAENQLKSIGRVHRTRERLPSDGFIESAPERPAMPHSQMRASDKTPARLRLRPTSMFLS